MAKKLFTPCRIIILVSAICTLAICTSWKSDAKPSQYGIFDSFFEPGSSDVLLIEGSNSGDTATNVTNTIDTGAVLSQSKSTVISNFAFVSDRFATRLTPGSFLALDLYQYHPNNPSSLEPLAQGVYALVFEDRPLINELNGQIVLADFANFGNQTVSESMRTIKPGYVLLVKFNPLLTPGFHCLTAIPYGPFCQIRGEYK